MELMRGVGVIYTQFSSLSFSLFDVDIFRTDTNFFQDGPFLVFNADEISFVSEVRRHFFPFVTLVGLEKNVDNIINCNPHLEGLNIAPNTGVLVQSSGEQYPVESIDQLKGLLMQE